MMKKTLFRVFAAVIVLSMAATTALAAGPGTGPRFEDADGDGVCDNYVPGQGCGLGRGAGFVDTDGDGICDNHVPGRGCGLGRGAGFVDTDGDGICDNHVPGQGCGLGRGARGGCGNGFRGGHHR